MSPVAPPSDNVRPATSRSIRLWGPGPSLSFTSTEAPAASSTWTTCRWPSQAARASGPVPRSGELSCRRRRDVPRHMSCFGGFRRISDLENWEFCPPFLIETCICITTNTNQYHVSSGLGSHTSSMVYIQIKSQIQIEHDPSKKSIEHIRNPFAFICHNQFY